MKNQKQIVFILFFLICNNLLAQDNLLYKKTVPDYVSYISKEFGVKCKIPNSFIDLNRYYELWAIRKNTHAGYLYGPIVQSKNEECILMYPYQPLPSMEVDSELGKVITSIDLKLKNKAVDQKQILTSPRGQIAFELQAAYGLLDPYGFHLRDSLSFDFDKYVTIIGGKQAREMFNSDSIYFYEIPLEQPYQNKYTYCTGMVLYKQNRKEATMIFKWFFTEQGKKKEHEYINLLSKLVWYDEKKR